MLQREILIYEKIHFSPTVFPVFLSILWKNETQTVSFYSFSLTYYVELYEGIFHVKYNCNRYTPEELAISVREAC